MTANRQYGRSLLPPPGPQRFALAVGLTATVLALVCLAVVLWFGDALLPAVPTLRQAGPLTTGGLPVAKLVMNAAGAITIGWLLLAVIFLPDEQGRLSAAGRRSLRGASISAVVWAVAGLCLAAFSISDLLGRPVPDVVFGGELAGYFVDLPDGQVLLAIIIAAAVLAVAAHLPKTPFGAGYLLLLALAAIIPPVFTGHAASTANHALAVFSLALHVVGAATWVGGLVVLVAIGWRLGDQLSVVVPRFSGLALGCFVAVGVSGLINGWIRLGGINLDSPYGKLVAAKAVAIVGLGLLGWWHRRASIPALRGKRQGRIFLRIAAIEVVVMAATIALATGLSRTPAPLLATPLESTAQYLLGFDLPGPPTLRAYALDWWIDWLLAPLVVAGAVLYGIGLARLRRRRVAWPVTRTVAWYTGLAVLFLVTSGGMARYSMVIFSAHMAQHLIVSAVVPIPLLLGAPVTLAEQTLRGSKVAGRSVRALFVALVRSKAVRALTHPLLALPVFVAALYGFYFTSLFELSLGDHALHSLSLMVFLVTGTFFLWPLIGGDRAPYVPDPTIRFVLLIAVAPVHAFFGIALMWSQGTLAEEWYSVLTRDWGPSVLSDQQFGGRLAWMMGLATTLLAMLVLLYQRFRGPKSSEPESGLAPGGSDEQVSSTEQSTVPSASPGG